MATLGEVPARAVPAVPGARPAPFPAPRAQSWEDPALLAALAVGPDDDALVFEPSGDDGLALATHGAGRVTVATPDAASHALVSLKRAAARELPVQSVRSLLGLGHFGRRVWFYHYLRPGLPPDAAAFLDAHEGAIRAGLVSQGAVERAMATFRARVLPILPRERHEGLRWAATARVWGPRLAALAGAPEADAGPRLLAALARPSFFADWLRDGAWSDPDCAHAWLSSAGLSAAKARIAEFHALRATRLDALRAGSWSVVVLGRAPLLPDEAAALASALRPGGRVLGWAVAAPPPLPAPLAHDPVATDALARADRGLFPGRPWLARR